MRQDLCRDFEEQVTELARLGPAGGSSEPLAELTRHASACGVCAALLRREQALQARLATWPEAPPRNLVPPAPTDDAPGRVVRLGFVRAACAAAVLAVAVWSVLPRPRSDVPTARLGDGAAYRILDDANPFPAWDDRLLELAAGAEQVASLRPAESR